MNTNHLVLFDGNSVINRAYFALAGRRPLQAPDGTPTGALLGFINILLKNLNEREPDHVCVAFDRREPTFRHQQYEDYKGTRKPMPDDLATQIPLVKSILQFMGIPIIEKAGYEADDLIGTLASQAGEAGLDVAIISGDRDGLQLVSDRVSLVLAVTRAGQTTAEVYNPDRVMEQYGIRPEQMIDVKALMGDSSDNIPGVRGIGEKGALELIGRYRTLDGVYDAMDELRPAVANKLKESREMAYLSRELARIDCQVPLDLRVADLKRQTPDREQLVPLLDKLGLHSILDRMNLSVESTPEINREVIVHKDMKASDILAAIRQTGSDLVAITSGEGIVYVAVGDTVYHLNEDQTTDLLTYCADEDVTVAGFEMKALVKNIDFNWHRLSLHDTVIAAYLLSHLDGKPDLRRIYEAGTGKRLEGLDLQEPKSRQTELMDIPNAKKTTEVSDETAARIAAAVSVLAKAQQQQLRDHQLTRLAGNIEMPLVPVLAHMEKSGFYVDRTVLQQLSAGFQARIEALEKDIHAHTGETFNINSPKQLSEVLFGKLGLSGGKKNANGTYSTGADILERLIDDHPAVPLILEFRQLSKLRSTFVEGLSNVIDDRDGRVHTTFNQAITTTGRLSSSEPNLQNIPVRSAVGREIRRAFTAEPGWTLLDADYSQIELRLLAHLSGDPAMTDAFLSGQDIHTNTASKIFKVALDQVTGDMRAAAKTVNFSIVYGISGFGLARDLGIGVAEAQRYIDEYYSEYPKVKIYLDGLVAAAYENGYVETLFGRRRYLQELKASNRNIRNFGERAAMNTPVQGTAADIMKIAMVKADQVYLQEKMEARLVLQVHDELIVECRPDEVEKASRILQASMEQAVALDIPMVAEVRSGNSWFDTK